MEKSESFSSTFFNLPWPLLVLAVAVPMFALAIILTYRETKRIDNDKTNLSEAQTAINIIASGLILVGAFAISISWQAQSDLYSQLSREFTSATAVAEDAGPQNPEVMKLLTTYATEVQSREIGTTGYIGGSAQAQQALEAVSRSVEDRIAAQTTVDVYSSFDLQHLENLKESRRERLSLPGPLIPSPVTFFLIFSAIGVVVAVSLHPSASRVQWKWIYSLFSASIITLVLAANFLLQSPTFNAPSLSKPIDIFLDSAKVAADIGGNGTPGGGTSPAPDPGQPSPQQGQPSPPPKLP